MINFQMGWLALLFQGIFLFSDRGCLSLPMDFPPQIPEGISYGFVLPEFDINQAGRVEEIRTNREGFQYGPPLLGNTSFFPTGVLGDAMVARDKELWFRDVAYVTESVYREWPAAAQALAEGGGLQNLSSYRLIYEGQWKATIPDGVSPGVLTNWTSDLLFSMERLSQNPYVVRRLGPQERLPFPVDADVARLASGMNLEVLHTTGRLFFADHSYQARYPTNPGRWTAACSAYFFIHPTTGNFMPLAIKTNMGADLVYTPEDDENDWLFAKMAFEMNDLFHGQLFHLANTHDVAEPVHQAALRTLSKRHPIRGYLDRLMYQAYAVRPIGEEFLFNEGGFYDGSFTLTNWAGKRFATEAYPTTAGRFRHAQFHNDLVSRGLLDSPDGPALKAFPFYETVSPMVAAIHDFTTKFVETYYLSDRLLEEDQELRAWIIEANDEAHVLDFPSWPLGSRSALVSILSHIAFLAGIGHHALNGATPGESGGILPLHPSAFNRPLPTAKGSIEDLMPYLHNETEALKQASLLVRFNRPLLEQQQGNLVNMFSGIEFMSRTSLAVQNAAGVFMRRMLEISDEIRGRTFDADGLSQGMPFIWRSLDPRKIPYYLSV